MWFDAFLKENFFESCSTHPLRKNELNKYCIDCNMLICQHCVSSGLHRHHKVLKVHRHLCKEVISLRAIEKYIDCSQIQVESVSKKSELENTVSTTPVESSSVPSIQSPPPPPPQGTLEGTSVFSFRKRKRKGIPQRAPFY
ncbi:protein RGF1 INDUCIBLE TRANSCRIPTION FACTOR [Trifolium repens]|nr:protein RGF1 INDUCIBLE TRANSCRIPTION FACTOR [Trifolium repens]